MNLKNKIAVVTGASRGVGKGIAMGLGEQGATVYISGRTRDNNRSVDGVPGSIDQTAEEVNALGGIGIQIECDQTDDEVVSNLFSRVQEEQGRLDILVNNAWAGYERMVEDGTYTWELPFWQQPLFRWDAMFNQGVRSAFTASQYAARLMTAQRSGLIVNISYWSAQKYLGNALYGTAKAAIDKMTGDMAHELKPYNVTAISLYPGIVRSERVLFAADFMDLTNSESPQFIGRVIAGLANDPQIMAHTGQVLVAARMARQYGIVDVDGKSPEPLTLDSV